jgi:hypothetical protein
VTVLATNAAMTPRPIATITANNTTSPFEIPAPRNAVLFSMAVSYRFFIRPFLA